ncbi:MAG: leucine--tRNA ligase [Candidatus Moranbacteria bacterium]|nr:leucine--tRNA ligase [Candidatus Moranbacteria bacterium]
MDKKSQIPEYDFKEIEPKWQKYWEDEKLHQPDMDKAKKPFYNLMMFPYPSAEGLHIGGVSTFTGVDTFGRLKKMQGYDVFEPIGLDGFGIHSENYAMKIGEHIKDVSARTEKNFYRQLASIGNMYDWSKTVETYKPEYYKWTQWLFLQMYKKGLAYQKKAKVNWCPSCKTVLSDEQVIQGKCERCDSEVQKKELKQWFFKITEYAEKLLKNLDWIDWPEDVKTNQRNWIGKSTGAIIEFPISNFQFPNKFKIQNSKFKIRVFTTRPDTLFGATYMVVAPEHWLISNFQFPISNSNEVHEYVKKALAKSEQERKAEEGVKTGVEIKGLKAVNPATGEEIPVWVADYVLTDYGTGAIMAVPGHDERDWEFAQKYGLEIRKVVCPLDKDARYKKQGTNKSQITNHKDGFYNNECFSGEGVAVSSGFLDGLETFEAKEKMIEWLEENGHGERSTDYKLRDWCISRQRYWGPPIPVVWCKNCAKPKALLIHGFEADGESNWFLSLKKQLEEQGFEVFNPSMPKSEHPELENWLEALQPYLDKLNENSIIVGHSLGSKAALHLLGKTHKKVSKLFLVASAIGNPKRNWDNVREKMPGADVESLQKFWQAEIDWESVNQSVDSSYIILSKDDPVIDPEHYKVAKLKDKKIEIWEGFKHFSKKRVPELEKYILENSEDLPKKTKNEKAPVPVSEKDLPVELPDMEDFLPEGKGKGPLAKNEEFVKTKCPVCGAEAQRETDVSDPFVDSSWYFFRYPSTEFTDKPFDGERTHKWLPVDSYIGGKEHTVLHLLYSRFITMVLNDLGHIDFDEPYKRFFGHGLITKDGAKMSKSKGNVVNPDEMIEKHGADTTRLYLRFLGDFEQGGDWRDSGVEGMSRFVKKLWHTFFEISGEGQGVKKDYMIDRTIKLIGEDIERLSFNTAVARYMEFVNWVRDNKDNFNREQALKVKKTLALTLAPMAPHLAEEFWSSLGGQKSIFTEKWPEYNPVNIQSDEIELVIQVNGKVRDKFQADAEISEEEAKKKALESEKIQKYLAGKEPKKVIYVKEKLVNIVI